MRSRGIDLGVVDKIKRYIKDHPGEGEKLLGLVSGDIDALEFNEVIEAADKDDKLSRSILEEAGNYLGAKIAFLINLFNPEIIVIGRGIEKAGDLFFSAVRKSVRKWAYEESVKVVKILPSSLGEDAVATGAAAFVIKNIFAQV